MNESKCRSCAQPVMWVLTPDMKRMPVDVPGEKRFTVVRVDDGGWPVVQQSLAYVSHFATCPDASKWRQR